MESLRSRARRSQRPSLPSPKCFIQVSIACSISTVHHLMILGGLGSQEFEFDISHWTNTSSQVPVCSVEPGTLDDVGLTVNLAFFLSTNPGIADIIYAHSSRRLPQIVFRLR